MPVYRVRNAILVTQPEKRARTRSSAGVPDRERVERRKSGHCCTTRIPSGRSTGVALSGHRPLRVVTNAPACNAVDLIGLDDDTRGRYWRTHYSTEIRRKSKGETSVSYSIVSKGVNADGDYYEVIEWNPMFLKQNKNTYRYWNNDGSFYECYPDWSDYYSKNLNHERYMTPRYGGFIRDANSGGGRVCKKAPHFEALVLERGLNNMRGPRPPCVFEPPWVTKRTSHNSAAAQRQSARH